MAVKIYVRQDAEGRAQPPNTAHEIQSVAEVVKTIWLAYHHMDGLCCLVINPRQPSADVIVIREQGIGILEFKEHAGKVTIDEEGRWFASGDFIKGGKYPDPHTQVQSYGDEVRRMLLHRIAPNWLKFDQWDRLKFQTGVCFANPRADISDTTEASSRLSRRKWESSFSILTPTSVSAWILALTFELDLGPSAGFRPYALETDSVVGLATDALKAAEWHDLVRLMPQPKPYAYLGQLEKGSESQVYNLTSDEESLGRALNSSVVVPERFKMSSRDHAAIRRYLRDVRLEDRGSRHGTFVNGRPVTQPRTLKNGDVITLGGPTAGEGVLALRFTKAEHRGGVGPTSS